MSRWNHMLCPLCYEAEEPGRTPHVIVGTEPNARCCRCNRRDIAIYYRADPERYDCKGTHEQEG